MNTRGGEAFAALLGWSSLALHEAGPHAASSLTTAKTDSRSPEAAASLLRNDFTKGSQMDQSCAPGWHYHATARASSRHSSLRKKSVKSSRTARHTGRRDPSANQQKGLL